MVQIYIKHGLFNISTYWLYERETPIKISLTNNRQSDIINLYNWIHMLNCNIENIRKGLFYNEKIIKDTVFYTQSGAYTLLYTR